MQFKFTALVFATLAAVAFAAPQQGSNCQEIFFPDNCAAHGQVECDGAGSIRICCDACF